MRISIPRSIIKRVADDLAHRRANGLPIPKSYLIHPDAYAEPWRDITTDALADAIQRGDILAINGRPINRPEPDAADRR